MPLLLAYHAHPTMQSVLYWASSCAPHTLLCPFLVALTPEPIYSSPNLPVPSASHASHSGSPPTSPFFLFGPPLCLSLSLAFLQTLFLLRLCPKGISPRLPAPQIRHSRPDLSPKLQTLTPGSCWSAVLEGPRAPHTPHSATQPIFPLLFPTTRGLPTCTLTSRSPHSGDWHH